MAARGTGVTMALTVRDASLQDAAALQAYAIRLFAERLPGIYRRDDPTLEEEQAFIRDHTEPDGSAMLVAEENGRIVGLLGFRARTLPQERHVGMFHLSVAAEARGCGVGTALITTLVERAPALGIRRIEVEAFAVNEGALRLYERLGFEREGARREAVVVDGRPVDVIMLARLLEEDDARG